MSLTADHRILELQQAQAVLRATRDAIVTTDLEGIITGWNPGAERLYGFLAEEVLDTSAMDYLVETGIVVGIDGLASGQHIAPFDIDVRTKDGGSRLMHVSLFGLYDEDGQLCGLGTVGHDVTEQRRLEHEARRNRLYDDVTGLPNRRLLETRIREAVAEGSPSAICVDLDRFRLVNDTWGHAVGDQVLDEVGRRLSALVPPRDTVGRLGGDQFLILRRDGTPHDVQRLAAAALAALDPPVEIPGHPAISIGASVGVAAASHCSTPDDLLRDADSAVHRAKQRGCGGRIVWFSDELRADATRRLLLQGELRRALDEDEIHVAFQPIVDVATGEVRGYETLARWTHPVLGEIRPDQFIPIAEEAGLIGRLGAAVLELTCQDIVRRADGLGRAVNLSTHQLRDDALVDLVRETLARHGVDPRVLTFEVVEGTLGDSMRVLATCSGLRRLGCRISVDDFGTGWSSLARIKQLPIDEIKIDRTFVSGLPDDPADLAVVTGVVGVARALQLDVVAEGVETEEQLAVVRSAGCSAVQGYLLGKPVAP